MKRLGQHLRLVQQFDLAPSLPRRRPVPQRASYWSFFAGIVLTTVAFILVDLIEQAARQRLGVSTLERR